MAKEVKITEEHIQQWKEKYGKVYKLVADDGSVGYIRKPDRKVLSHALAASGNDGIKINEIVLRDCWLGGDESFMTDDAKFMGVASQLDKIIEIAQVELVEL